MSAWPGKYVIGLTGNIATGKSVVRKMLEHLGAYGIDADALGHRAIAKDAPGYRPVLETFGTWTLAPDGQIDRSKLARIVFSDPMALLLLETIVHPLVRQAVDILVRRSPHKVIVIEAIKLLESPLRTACDTIWVTYASPVVQINRLMQKRGMSKEAARQRIDAQPPQHEKVAVANTLIRNEGSFAETWRQVSMAWREKIPVEEAIPSRVDVPKGELAIEKARPRQAAEIASLINHLSKGKRNLTSDDVMASFGEKAFIMLRQDDRTVGLAGWQVENLVARTDDVYLEPELALPNAMRALLEEIERASRDLQCEVSLLFLPPRLSQQDSVWHNLGYEQRSIPSLGVKAWQEAAQETMSGDEVMFFKLLRRDRVLRPV